MSWSLVIYLALGAYAFKVLGLIVIGDRPLPGAVERCLALIPAAMIAALVVKDTFSSGQHLGLDARAIGMIGATIAAWRKAPLIAIVVLGAALTAGVRALGGV